MNILVTGVAGFIGYHVAERLLAMGANVFGLDNLNSYYDPSLKRARLGRISSHANFRFEVIDIADRGPMEDLFAKKSFDVAIHLAAQAGVRYSIEDPHVYIDSNVKGFLHVIEGARRDRIGHLVYASSSSVYGGNRRVPFSTSDRVDHPVSLYAVTKRANELMASCYEHLFKFPATGLRFFTVYGPWGRPDMAAFRFAQAILRGQAVDIYNYGHMKRDFTYISDIVEGVVRIALAPGTGHRLFNVGNSQPVGLMDFIHALEAALGKRARRRFVPMQPGDVPETHADVEAFWVATGFRPSTPVFDGVAKFAAWFQDYYGGRLDEHRTNARSRTLLQAS